MEGLDPNSDVRIINHAIFVLTRQIYSMQEVMKIWALFPRAPRGIDS